MVATQDAAAHVAQRSKLRASLQATGCRLRASIGDVSHGQLLWSSILLCWADGHQTQFLASTYHIQNDGQTDWVFQLMRE